MNKTLNQHVFAVWFHSMSKGLLPLGYAIDWEVKDVESLWLLEIGVFVNRSIRVHPPWESTCWIGL